MTHEKSLTKTVASGFLIISLAACGGGGSSSGAGMVDDRPDTAMIDDYLQANGQLRGAAVRASEIQVTALGRASFAGALDGKLSGSDVSAAVDVVLDLSGSNADVTVSNFNQDLSGQLTGQGTVIADAVGDLPQFIVVVEGELSRSGEILPSQLGLDGTFLRDGTDATGVLAGQADGEIGEELLIGRFAATR